MEGLGGYASAPEFLEGGFPHMAAVTVGERVPVVDAEGLADEMCPSAAGVSE